MKREEQRRGEASPVRNCMKWQSREARNRRKDFITILLLFNWGVTSYHYVLINRMNQTQVFELTYCSDLIAIQVPLYASKPWKCTASELQYWSSLHLGDPLQFTAGIFNFSIVFGQGWFRFFFSTVIQMPENTSGNFQPITDPYPSYYACLRIYRP